MEKKQLDRGHQFAMEFLNDIKKGTIKKDCMVNHSYDFTGGMENLYRDRFNMYLSSCGCYLMDMRLHELEEGYCG